MSPHTTCASGYCVACHTAQYPKTQCPALLPPAPAALDEPPPPAWPPPPPVPTEPPFPAPLLSPPAPPIPTALPFPPPQLIARTATNAAPNRRSVTSSSYTGAFQPELSSVTSAGWTGLENAASR